MVLVLPATGGGAAAGYVVREGDTLTDMADRMGTTVDDLIAANALEDPDLLPVGTVLTLPGSWRCPVDGPVWFGNDFGVPWGEGSTHKGIDLFAARGTPVVAPVAGVVERHPNPLGGEAFALSGDDGVWYYGAHLDSYGAEGRVTAGTVVGYVGDSGDGPGHVAPPALRDPSAGKRRRQPLSDAGGRLPPGLTPQLRFGPAPTGYRPCAP